jgi:hypothetical protein
LLLIRHPLVVVVVVVVVMMMMMMRQRLVATGELLHVML